MEDAAREWDAEVGLEVLAVVPGERGDAVARAKAQVPQGAGEPPRARRELGVLVAMKRRVHETRDDFPPPRHRFRAAEDSVEGQRVVHHQALHEADSIGKRISLSLRHDHGRSFSKRDGGNAGLVARSIAQRPERLAKRAGFVAKRDGCMVWPF